MWTTFNNIVHFFTRTALRKDILLALLIKCTLLFLLWKLCFSHPVADQLSHWDVMKHLVVSTSTG